VATWSAAPFGNDDAVEFFHAVEPLEPADVPAALRDALLDVTGNEGYLDLLDANRGIAAAAIVAALTADPDEAGIEDDAVQDWLASTDIDLPQDLPALASDALDRVVDDDSEWIETWSVTDDRLDEARRALEAIRSLLE
jgi:Domain of unknown function (DUF4259)